MSIRRVSELPSLNSLDPQAQLSDCLFEVSFDTSNGQHRYRSAYIRGEDLSKTAAAGMQTTSIPKITIGGELNLSSTVMKFDTGSSIMAWSEEPPRNTSCLLRFDIVKIQGDTALNLAANPVVINDVLSVYTDRLVSNGQIQFNNATNLIQARSMSTTEVDSNAMSSYVVTCKTLKDTVGAINSALANYTTGEGV